MPERVEPLSPSGVANAKPQAMPYVLCDGRGLLLIDPSGSKLWRLDYRRHKTGPWGPFLFSLRCNREVLTA